MLEAKTTCTGEFSCDDPDETFQDIKTSPFQVGTSPYNFFLTQVDDSTISVEYQESALCNISWTYAPEGQQTNGVASKMGGLFLVGVVFVLFL
jgi:hypothetical protein